MLQNISFRNCVRNNTLSDELFFLEDFHCHEFILPLSVLNKINLSESAFTELCNNFVRGFQFFQIGKWVLFLGLFGLSLLLGFNLSLEFGLLLLLTLLSHGFRLPQFLRCFPRQLRLHFLSHFSLSCQCRGLYFCCNSAL